MAKTKHEFPLNTTELHAMKKDEIIDYVLDLQTEFENQPVATDDPNAPIGGRLMLAGPDPELVVACFGKLVDPVSRGPMDDQNFNDSAPKFVKQAVILAQLMEAELASYGSATDEGESGDEVE